MSKNVKLSNLNVGMHFIFRIKQNTIIIYFGFWFLWHRRISTGPRGLSAALFSF